MTTQESVLAMMNQASAVYLATHRDGAPRIRAMVNLRLRDDSPAAAAFCQAEGFTCYFATSGASGKVEEIRKAPTVAVYFANPAETFGVELRGEMEILTDPELKRMLWGDGWRIYWPSGPEDDDYVVLRLRPRSAEGWRGCEPFRLPLLSEGVGE